ncbi:hypothetical protein D3C76_1702500 [compost metagenome]
MAGADVTAFGEFRQRVEGDEIADGDTKGFAVGMADGVGVETHFDVVPADRQAIHLGIEGVS